METREQVIAFIKDVKFGYLATIGPDNAPRVRPVGAYTVYGDALYFFTFKMTRKVTEITAHPQAEIAWARLNDNAQVRMRGALSLEEDPDVQARFKADNPMVAQMLPPGADQLFALFKLEPEVVEAVIGLKPYNQVTWKA
ncbi:MAG: pyridoxamine 5'-phosphate oxidase family protein [Anaerolineae bacterium]|nr:pyridoxamine 5'-phosphate oxidase family protein [Anaerolineae bacterium]